MDEKSYTVAEVAAIINKHITNVYPLVRKGIIKAYNISSSKRKVWRIKESDLKAFMNNG